ncbi:RelA/SpoT family protein [Dehalobacter restrictus]|uniref:GTP diphosphokinase n=1 Tax=Dehalobacter restrictus TaxID=55583 RepID=A0A857DK40_9FIRM|nr:bifunctional (p)ppGpp synthetase/guanosine-3',5'-bis(diphosphate) 3'-pyrophosphohydrolase [Dehalobacter restrictus]QHA00745.1 RelA/SpoT family protein [Dehalobacter restrictus]
MNFQQLKETLISNNAQYNLEKIEEAYEYAELAHRGQLRNSGEKYIYHPLEVASILAELEMDDSTIIAALLHDVAEDTNRTLEDIRKNFGDEVAGLVDGVTKLGKISYKSKVEVQVENLRKMFLAMAKDIRVILIKLADRLHNMRTLKYQSESKQKEIAQETIEIYAPLANRLGIFRIKWELEDLAFRYLHSQEYYDLVEGISLKRKERQEQIDEVIEQLKIRLDEVGIEADIAGRPKHFFSIYKKMLDQNKDLSEIFDLTAVRVIVKTVNDCYGALGVIHTLWKPIPGRFKDYIAMPKPNMYQSLHTTLIGNHGDPFEIQIRTWEMHRTAEYGIAAHWKYKEGKKIESNFEQKLSWIRQLLEVQHDSKDDAGEFMESLKIDLFADTVFVFTPKGDVVELPADSCPIDFAYRVHTDVGHSCIGAKINGRIVPLDTKLKNGDIVEILTTKTPTGPSRDWVCLVKTSQAKNRIRQWFKKEKREENIIRGREGLEREARKLGLEPSTALKSENMIKLAKSFSFNNIDDLYAAMGDGAITFKKALGRLKEEILKEELKTPLLPIQAEHKHLVKHSQGVSVKGVNNILIRFSRCCNPLPGDSIIGYITRGRGVSIHRADCSELVGLTAEEQERIVEVEWEAAVESIYPVDIEIIGLDRVGLVSDIMNVITETRTHMLGMSARVGKDRVSHIRLRIEVKNLDHLNFVLNKFRKVKDVTVVERIQGGGNT